MCTNVEHSPIGDCSRHWPTADLRTLVDCGENTVVESVRVRVRDRVRVSSQELFDSMFELNVGLQ